jgi:CHAT domain-containing protein
MCSLSSKPCEDMVTRSRKRKMSLKSRPCWISCLSALALLFVTIIPLPSSGAAPSPDELMKQGAQAFQHGAVEQALASWKEATRLYEQTGRTLDQSRALVLAAQASTALGQTKQALQSLDLALVLAQQTGDQVWIATVLGAIGETYLATRQLDAAQRLLTQAVEQARKEHAEIVLASLLNTTGILRAMQRQDQEALALFTESTEVAQHTSQQPILVNARVNAARATLRLGQAEGSRIWLDQAFDLAINFAPSREKAGALITIGLTYHDLRSSIPSMSNALLLRAAGVLQEAATLAEHLGDQRMLSYALGHLGHLYELEYRSEESLQLTRRAIFAAQSASAPESLYRWHWQMGRLLASIGRLDEGIASYRQAVVTLQPIRSEVAFASYDPSGFDQESIRPLFFELSDLLLQRAGLTDDALAIQEYLRLARDAIESYKAAELRDYFRDDCVDALQARITKLDQLAAGTAVVYPIMFADRLELLVSLPNGLKRLSTPVSSTTLTQEVRDFRKTVEKRTTREYLPHAQQLYAWLIQPLEQDLASFQIDTLVFVPDGPLRTIPMAALHDGRQFLIEKFALANTPGLNLTDPKPIDRDKVRLLSSGLTRAVQGFPSLPFVEEEINAIRTLYQGDQLLNTDFLTPRLEQELQNHPYGILHIATHGWFASDTTQSYLLTYNGKLTINELDRLIGLFRYRKDPLELLTLSACQTGIGDDRSALGLAGVAIKAGARSALATLWFINDEASATLVSEFYRQLRNPTQSKAQALQQAQQKLLADRVYEHPAYWSPFLLLNNWL